jgi:UDP-N-acetyl-2-amino-2-deoxyglucuronate dehydrogenase
MTRFALIGAAGYIAPRHMKAIKETGNNLVVSYDPFDSVGILDSYFPDSSFFTEFERFDRYIDKMKRKNNAIDYFSICSPNYLHDSHIRYGLRNNANVICEKPLVINPWNIDSLIEMEKETGKKVNTILQLRLHDKIIDLKKIVQNSNNEIFNVDLTYITSRGLWYNASWKGDNSKSGGISTNIGIHFFDMLYWVFGKNIEMKTISHNSTSASGLIIFEKAKVNWFLSINSEDLPESVKIENKKTFRSILINGKEFEFSDGFTDLHTTSYKNILNNKGFGLEDARHSIEIAHQIRNSLI